MFLPHSCSSCIEHKNESDEYDDLSSGCDNTRASMSKRDSAVIARGAEAATENEEETARRERGMAGGGGGGGPRRATNCRIGYRAE